MKTKHYVVIFLYQKPLSGNGIPWLVERISLARRTSILSLQNQTNQGFEIVIVTNKESLPILKDLLGKQYTYIITKKDRRKVLDKSLYDRVYITRLDSDDMYHPTVIQDIKTIKLHDATGLANKDGFLYNVHSGKLAKFHHKSSAFQTVVHIGSQWQNVRGLGLYEHQKLWDKHKVKILPPWKYLYIIHDRNDSSGNRLFKSCWCGEIIKDDREKHQILGSFNYV